MLFSENPALSVIRSDWYMLCCTAFHVKDCEPQGEFVSSCTHLFSSTIQKVIIVLQGIVSTSSNCIVLVSSLISPTPDNILLVSLAAADFLMGVYLIILAVVDFQYDGIFYRIVSEWTQNAACWGAAACNFVSSEASLFILAIVSVARTYSVGKVGGLRLIKRKILSTCISSWIVVWVCCISYIINLYVQQLRLRNNICMILGISHKRYVSPFEFYFQISVVVINILVLITLCSSTVWLCCIIYQSHKDVNYLASQTGVVNNSRVLQLGIRLLLLIMCNVVCWIPILTVSCLLLLDIAMHEDVMIWLAILIIPISSTANPFLYNAHVFKCKKK